MYTDCGFTLLHSRNEQNIIKQLYANKTFFKKEKKNKVHLLDLKLSFSSVIISINYEFLLKNSLTFIFSLLLPICLAATEIFRELEYYPGSRKSCLVLMLAYSDVNLS